jgi:hypothetical protein
MNGTDSSLIYAVPSWPMYIALAIGVIAGGIDGLKQSFLGAIIVFALLPLVWICARIWPPIPTANIATLTTLAAGLFSFAGYVVSRIVSWLFKMWALK